MKKWWVLTLLLGGCKDIAQKNRDTRIKVMDNTLQWADSMRKQFQGIDSAYIYYDSIWTLTARQKQELLQSSQ